MKKNFFQVNFDVVIICILMGLDQTVELLSFRKMYGLGSKNFLKLQERTCSCEEIYIAKTYVFWIKCLKAP